MRRHMPPIVIASFVHAPVKFQDEDDQNDRSYPQAFNKRQVVSHPECVILTCQNDKSFSSCAPVLTSRTLRLPLPIRHVSCSFESLTDSGSNFDRSVHPHSNRFSSSSNRFMPYSGDVRSILWLVFGNSNPKLKFYLFFLNSCF